MEYFTPEAHSDEYGAREWERLESGFNSRLEYEETRSRTATATHFGKQSLRCGATPALPIFRDTWSPWRRLDALTDLRHRNKGTVS